MAKQVMMMVMAYKYRKTLEMRLLPELVVRQ